MHNGTITPHVFRSVSKEQHYEENGCQVGTVFSALVRAAPNLQNWLVLARASTPLSCHILINSTLITRARRSTVFSRQNKKIVYPPDPNTHLCQTGDWKLSGQQCHSFALIIGGCGHWFLLWRRSILRGFKVCTSSAAETTQHFFVIFYDYTVQLRHSHSPLWTKSPHAPRYRRQCRLLLKAQYF